MIEQWTIEGAGGEPIIGDAHRPHGAAAGVVIIAHGFKGYKDYGMFPRIATDLAERGFVAHRFNFSHSGMTANTATFERPDLFEKDTWNKQVHDLTAVMDAVAGGSLAGQGLPVVLFGHSRGGVTVLLTASRRRRGAPAGVATAAAPSSCNSLSPQQQQELLDKGFLVSPSSRTGQDLRIGRAFLTEQLEDPQGHDLPAAAARITCPALIVHGENDPTVPAACARELADAMAAPTRVVIVPGADHVFNTPNPLPPDAAPSPQLAALLSALGEFASECCGR